MQSLTGPSDIGDVIIAFWTGPSHIGNVDIVFWTGPTAYFLNRSLWLEQKQLFYWNTKLLKQIPWRYKNEKMRQGKQNADSC